MTQNTQASGTSYSQKRLIELSQTLRRQKRRKIQMTIQPFSTYPGSPAEVLQVVEVVSKTYVNEPGQVSFGTIDYVPGWHVSLHHHNVWELILIDGGSAGAGFVMFGGRWWRAEPGSAVFVPKNYPHAWSS